MASSTDSVAMRLETIERKIDAILSALQIDIAPNCQRMGDHITFIEGVYVAARAPLAWLTSKLGGDTTELPAIADRSVHEEVDD